MLVLTRKEGEKIVIGNDIVITILSTNENSAKIGIQAPNNISIYRYEIYEKIKTFIKEASSNSELIFDTDKTDKVKLNKLNR
ncbi:MAG TPA: carbon storage regulator CsrA [Ignavibacteriales bacterium]|nr:carbon storage regulator CsrA [Ignavibacteriales bacterium]HOL81297.1 carbon storage regulator CsrA [Ignavibacteriales bacterium]HOM66047.1 carbon storage regulator CsrA [Ignavibacteriales bacterium]HPD67539.1 carbon storage regulator CsrA [Ignavibacteriales bacterium]HPP33407.1 carbon storage regulator CsrA [Ignavibacteriales bacterium]